MKAIQTQETGTVQEAKDALEELLRKGARKMLEAAIENEVAESIEAHKHEVDENGHR